MMAWLSKSTCTEAVQIIAKRNTGCTYQGLLIACYHQQGVVIYKTVWYVYVESPMWSVVFCVQIFAWRYARALLSEQKHFCQSAIKKLNQGNGPALYPKYEQSAEVVYALRLVVLVVFSPWINYSSLECWSTFWKHCFKRQLVRKFGMVQKLFYFLLCMNIYFVLFSTSIACSSCSSISYF